MKHTTVIFRILALAILAAVVLFFGVQIYGYVTNPFSTTIVYNAKTEDSVAVEGWVIRDEETIQASGTLVYALSEGQKAGSGELLATAYDSTQALDTVKSIEEKELQLQQLEFALSTVLDPDAALKLDGTIKDTLLTLRSQVSSGDYAAASEEVAELKADILKRSHSYSSAAEIQAQAETVQSEIAALKNSLSGAQEIRAQKPGIFSAVCDGYESVLTPGKLEKLTPSQLESLTAQPTDGTMGKLIYGTSWYYAVTVSADQAAQLEEAGQATLRMSYGLEQDVTAEVLRVGPEEGGKQVVVLRCRDYLSQVTQLRRQSGELVMDSHTGLRIPANALRLNEEGQSGVYCMVGYTAKFKPVTVTYQGDGYTLVEPAEGATGSQILRPGDEVIVTASDLYDGKVVA